MKTIKIFDEDNNLLATFDNDGKVTISVQEEIGDDIAYQYNLKGIDISSPCLRIAADAWQDKYINLRKKVESKTKEN